MHAYVYIQTDIDTYVHTYIHVGSCQNYGPFLGTLHIRRIISRTQKGTLILTTICRTRDLHSLALRVQDSGCACRVLGAWGVALPPGLLDNCYPMFDLIILLYCSVFYIILYIYIYLFIFFLLKTKTRSRR